MPSEANAILARNATSVVPRRNSTVFASIALIWLISPVYPAGGALQSTAVSGSSIPVKAGPDVLGRGELGAALGGAEAGATLGATVGAVVRAAVAARGLAVAAA